MLLCSQATWPESANPELSLCAATLFALREQPSVARGAPVLGERALMLMSVGVVQLAISGVGSPACARRSWKEGVETREMALGASHVSGEEVEQKRII